MVKVTDHKPRVLMLGIDAMSLPFARAHLDQMPAFRSLLEKAALRSLKTSGAYFSGSQWATFASGKHVGDHGIYFPFQWDANSLRQRRQRDSAWREQFELEPFWYELSRSGIPCTVLDAGYVLTSEQAPCRQITNWSYGTTAWAESSDRTLLAQIQRRFGRRPIGRDVPVPKGAAQCNRIRDQLIAAVERKADAILWLMQTDDWRFFLAGFYEIHRAGHILWPSDWKYASKADPNALLEVYKAQDRQLQRIIDHAVDERTTCILFALQGMGPNAAQNHFLPKVMSRLNANYLAAQGITHTKAKRESLVSKLRKAVPYNLQATLAELLGERAQDWVVNRSDFGAYDWPRTPAFPVSTEGPGYLRLNIKQREAQGFFEPGSREIDDYVDWLRQALLSIRVVKTNEPLVKSVALTRDLFPGERNHLLPDLVLDWKPVAPVEHIASDKIGEIHERLQTGRGGNHTGECFMLIAGPGAARIAAQKPSGINDIGRFVRACFAGS